MRKTLRTIGRIIGIAIAVIIVVAGAAYPISDWTRATLNQAARDELVSRGEADTFVTTSEGVMHVRLSGPLDGPKVMLIHGAVVGGYGFENWRKPLADAGFRVIAPDLLGYGYSERPDVSYTREFYMTQIHDLIDGLNIDEPISMVGASFGGAVVIDYTYEHPEDVASLGLMAPAGLGRGQLAPPVLMWPVVGDWAFRVLGPRIVTQQMADAYANSPARDDMIAWMKQQSRYRGFGEGILNTLRNYDFEWRPEAYLAVGKSGIPVFAAWGTDDAIHPYERTTRLKEWVPQTQLLTIAGAGHAITYGRAPDVLAAYIPSLMKDLSPAKG